MVIECSLGCAQLAPLELIAHQDLRPRSRRAAQDRRARADAIEAMRGWWICSLSRKLPIEQVQIRFEPQGGSEVLV